MGGWGALHIGFKYPKLFARVSAIAPTVLHDMSLEPDERIANTLFGDPAYYHAVAPWTLLLLTHRRSVSPAGECWSGAGG